MKIQRRNAAGEATCAGTRLSPILTVFVLLFVSVHGLAPGSVRDQLDELVALAQGKRIGMITNPSGCDEAGGLDSEYVMNASGTTITAFFAPEHGIRGDLPAGYGGGDYVDPATGIPVYAIYGVRTAPTSSFRMSIFSSSTCRTLECGSTPSSGA